MIRNTILRRDALVKRLKAGGPIISGSVVQGDWKCNISRCRCKKGKLHSAVTLTWKEEGKTRTLYIPIDLREEVKGWNEEYKRIKGLIEEISELNRVIIRSHVKIKRARRKYV